MLTTVEVLRMNRCSLINSLSGLSALRELEMIGVEGIESGFEVFELLTKLTIGKVNNRKKTVHSLEKASFLSTLTLRDSNLPIDSLTQVNELFLINCDRPEVFPITCIQLKSLKFVDCKALVSFPAFPPCLQFLDIEGCSELPLLKIFGEPSSPCINRVKIARCAELKRIHITRRIT
jgi:hypothetical protein